jgi:hypothetical protein
MGTIYTSRVYTPVPGETPQYNPRNLPEMTCKHGPGREETSHSPHDWNSDVVFYGPYHCFGYPYQGPKHRKGNF